MAVNPVQLEWWSFSEITSQIIKCFRKRDDIKKKRHEHDTFSYLIHLIAALIIL